jgi:glycosyltransferase involved in cell wall biosynthesis
MTDKPTSSSKGEAQALISVVLPAHNEEAGINRAFDVIGGILDESGVNWEIIVVDDGSRDQTFAMVASRARTDHRIRGIRFSRNFGKEGALLAGINAAQGDAVITMDADLQHPPSLIPQMIDAWRLGAKVVHAVKRQRKHDSAIMKVRAWAFNTVITWLGGINIQNSSDFKLLDRVVVDVIARQLPERRRFFRGLADWVGYKNVEILFDVAERSDGEGKWSFFGLVELALTALVSFTSAPLRIVTVMGLFTLTLGVWLTIETLVSWFHGNAVSGFATTILTLLIIGSFIMISLGVIGEYIAKIYEEVKARPVYLIDETVEYSQESFRSSDSFTEEVMHGRAFQGR